MKTIKLFLAVLLASAATGSAIAGAPDDASKIIRGRYQAVLGDCTGCHTKRGGAPFAGGEPLQTPFGALVPPNITPDPETGIGGWSEADFFNTMKRGIGHGGKRLYPAMPYPAYTKMHDGDISDLWSYIRTLEPVHNAVEANQLPFPFNIRLSMLGWNAINFTESEFKPDPQATAEWNRGAYLVEGPGHCVTCHSPKSVLGADETDGALTGASLQGWYAPDITGNAYTGVGGWSEEEIVTYLKTGANTHSIASGPMAEAVENSTSHMKDDDLKAIATYLKSIKSDAVKPAPVASGDAHLRAGARIYHDTCSACHGGDGQGARQLFPALAGSPIVQQPNAETLIHLVLNGSRGAGTEMARTTPAMPSLAFRLDDQQVADVLTYIRNSWGNAAPPVEGSAVADQRNPE